MPVGFVPSVLNNVSPGWPAVPGWLSRLGKSLAFEWFLWTAAAATSAIMARVRTAIRHESETGGAGSRQVKVRSVTYLCVSVKKCTRLEGPGDN